MIVTWNGKMFDIPFLMTRFILSEPEMFYDIKEFLEIKHIDLQEVTFKRVSLDDMASLLGIENKIGNGLQAIELAKNKQWNELKKYCMKDVEITEKVFLKLKELGVL